MAAGPVGRTGAAATDAQITAEMLSYSRAKGLFAGIDLSGGVLQPDKSANVDVYGAAINPADVLAGRTPAPASASVFVTALGANARATTGVK